MLSQAQFNAFMDDYYTKKSAQIRNAIISNRDQLESFTIDLSTEVTVRQRTYRIDKPFKAISFEDATDQDAYVLVQFDSQREGKGFKKFKQNSSLRCETMFNGCTIYFPAQVGKTISCTIYYDCDFVSGSLINEGTVSLALPNVITVTNPAINAGSETLLLAAASDTKKVTIQNNTGATLYIGATGLDDSGANKGLELPSGSTLELENQAAIYCYSVGGGAAGTVTVVKES